MSDILIVVNTAIFKKKDHRQGIPRNNVLFLEIIQTEGRSLLEYADVAKASIGLMNKDRQGAGKINLCHWEMS